MSSTIVHIFKLTNIKYVVENVALRSDVINVKRTLSTPISSGKIFLGHFVMHLSSINNRIICLANRAKIKPCFVFLPSRMRVNRGLLRPTARARDYAHFSLTFTLLFLIINNQVWYLLDNAGLRMGRNVEIACDVRNCWSVIKLKIERIHFNNV